MLYLVMLVISIYRGNCEGFILPLLLPGGMEIKVVKSYEVVLRV